LLLAIYFCLSANAAATADSPPKEQAKRSDCFGDALPAGALARLGTVRFRHGGSVFCAHFSADGKTLTSYGEDNVFRTWDAATGKELRSCRRRGVQPEFFGSAALSADGRLLALGCGSRGHEKDGTVILCAVATGAELHKLTVLDGGWAVRSLAFSSDGKLLAAGDDNGHIDIWETATGRKRRRLNWECEVTGLAFSPDGRLLASGNGRDELSLWDAASGKSVRCLQTKAPGFVGKNTFETHLAFTPDGKTLASANSDNAVRLWDVASGKEIRRIHREDEGVKADDHFKSVHSLAFSPDGKLLAVDSADGFLHLWSVATGEKLRRIDTQHGLFGWRVSVALAFAPDGRTLTAWGTENAIRLWDVRTGKERAVRDAHRGTVCTAAFSTDGRKIATAGDDRRVRLWSPTDGRSQRVLLPPKGVYGIRSVAFSPDDRMLATPGEHRTIYRWRLANGVVLPSLKPKGETEIFAVAFAPKGRILAAVGRAGGGGPSVILWDPDEGKPIREWETEECLGLAFSPDGAVLAIGGGESIPRGNALMPSGPDYRGRIDLWDPATGRKLRHWTIADSMVKAVAFTPNGRWLASLGDQDRLLRLWDVSTGKAVRQWKDADCLAISPAGRLIAASDHSGVVRLWDLFTGELVEQLKGHRGPVFSLAFAPDGRTLVSGSADTTALVWDMVPLYQQRRSAGAALTARQLDALWNDLGSRDSALAYRAIGGLAVDAERSVPLLKCKLGAVWDTPERIAGLIRDLDADEFTTREKALAELEKLGEAALPALRKCLDNKPTLEQRRRMELLLKKQPGEIETAGCLQTLRGIEVLDAVATVEARRVLETLAEGDTAAYVRREAKAALQRLRSRLPATSKTLQPR
jgi:WD40 repeat protein